MCRLLDVRFFFSFKGKTFFLHFNLVIDHGSQRDMLLITNLMDIFKTIGNEHNDGIDDIKQIQ